jgi:hypothetical protein
MAIEFVLDLELWMCQKRESLQKNTCDEHDDCDLEIRPLIKFRPDYCLPPSKKKRPFFPPSNLNMINWVKLLVANR